MNLLFSIFFFTLSIAVNIDCQPLADSKNGFVNFFIEMLNPSFRRHRARIRPFTNQFGSPVISIRGTRDLEKTLRNVQVSSAECVYTLETLFCSGMDFKGNNKTSECDSDLELKSTSYQKFNTFWLTSLKLVNLTNEIGAKFNLHAQMDNKFKLKQNIQFGDQNGIEVFSLHLKDNLEDFGIGIKNSSCWSEMIRFFLTLKENSVEGPLFKNELKTVAKITIL